MNSELNKLNETESTIRYEIVPGFEGFIPSEFIENPLEYFENRGQNLKSGEIKLDDTGRVREDPTAVKELPVWVDASGQELVTVAKRVDVSKGKVGESGDPFYEFRIMELVASLGLPCARPIAKVEQKGIHLIIMEKVPGIKCHERDFLELQQEGLSEEDIENIKKQAESLMNELKKAFDEAGIIRNWKLNDMILEIDKQSKVVTGIIPVDWERTKINTELFPKPSLSI